MPTASYNVEYLDGTWQALADSAVLDAAVQQESASSDSGVGFGDQVTASATLKLRRAAVAALTWPRRPVRVTYTMGAGSARSFVGVVREWDGDLDTVEWSCDAMIADLPNRTKNLYSPLFERRPAATATTVTSIEAPTDPDYRAGLINWVLWQAGGRPLEQVGDYPDADFYYSCEQAILAPDWAWIAGEDGWAECLRLARAVGGQLYQALDGTIRYQQPLTLVGASSHTFTLSNVGDVQEQGTTDQYAETITCAFTPRAVAATQNVIQDSTFRVVQAGASITIPLEPKWPLYSVVLDAGTLKDKNIVATFFDGRLMPYHASDGFTATVTIAAMQITIAFTNNTSLACQISKITIDGAPIVAGETGTETAGSGDAPIKLLEDNIFVQSHAHAEALAGMALSFYQARTVRTFSGCVYEPGLDVGDTAAATFSALGLSGALHRITGAQIDDTGVEASYTCVDVTGVPQLSEYYLVASGAQTGPRKIAW